MTAKVENKVTILSDTFKELPGNKMNLARKKFSGLSVCALRKAKTVYLVGNVFDMG